MALAAELLGDRWTLLILREAFYGVIRYDDMLADLGAPRSMLTDRLSRLVERGLMERSPYQEPGSRARQAYTLTTSGRALGITLIALSAWGEEHILGEPGPVEFIDNETLNPVSVALTDAGGHPISLSNVKMRLKK